MSAAAPEKEDDRTVEARRLRGLATVARARVVSACHRLFASALIALVAASLVEHYWPLYWFIGYLAMTLADLMVFQRLAARCEDEQSPRYPHYLIAWVCAQSVYASLLAVMLWFAPYASGETLAAIYLCAACAGGVATLRKSHVLSIAGLTPMLVMLLSLPTAEYFLSGANNPLLLMPLAGGFLLLSFGATLWRSLLAADVAQARAEVSARRERQAAAAAAAAKSDMIQRMNDELRTPMQALIGAAEYLRRAAVTPEARAHIATLVQAGELLKLVLDDLSDLDRLENGALRIEAAPADPREIVRGVASAFRAAAQDKNLELFVDLGETPALVELDARRVRQVLFNLVANAVRYTTHGGVRIRLAARSAETPGRVRLLFDVADTGAGMTRAHLARVFGRERVGGSGLGLAISLRLARLMGGTIQAKSEPEQGSVFTLVLEAPVAAARSAA